MYLPDFDYYAPDSIAEVSQILTEYEDAMILSGGTDVLTKMKNGVLAPKVLVSLKKVIDQSPSFSGVEYVDGKGVVIGGACTHNGLVFSAVMNQRYNSVSNAAQTVAANQVRHAGTVAGNIINAVPSADLPPILIALQATVTFVSAKGSRSLPLEEVFLSPGKTVIERGEVLTEVVIPDQSMTGSTYFKYALRKAGALATIGVAAALEMDGKVIKDIRVAFGAVAPVPMRAPKVEAFMKGKEATEENLEAVAAIAYDECKPITDFRASEEYRRDLVGIFTKRAILKAIAEGHN
ncbi:MAG: xanthine dehydrogenase family protein subunit M [Clostridiales bacterium]|nr:xanthine dehydrogenase family protein subunit M [Clostridiales bacterium]